MATKQNQIISALSRRSFLTVAGATAGVLSACSTSSAMRDSGQNTVSAPFDSIRDYVAAMDKAGNVMRFDRIDQDAYEGTALMYRLVDRFGWRCPLFPRGAPILGERDRGLRACKPATVSQ